MDVDDQMTFEQVLANTECSHEIGTPFYVRRGDYLAIHLENEPYFAERIDDVLTVYRSQKSKELIGCKVKGVSILAQNVMNILHVEDAECEFRLFLLNALGQHKETKQYYYDLSDKCGSALTPVREILGNAA